MCCSNNYYTVSPMAYGGVYPVSYTCYPASNYSGNGGCCNGSCGGGYSLNNSLALIALYSLLCR